MISAMLLRSLIVDAENEGNNENKMVKFRKKENYVSAKKGKEGGEGLEGKLKNLIRV